MRKTFPGYYRPTEDEFSRLWNNCLFVVDANVLLNLYRYSQETSREFIGILDHISDRLWVPHQAALEYQQRRLDVIAQQVKAYDEIQKLLDETQNKLENGLRGFQRHPSIDADRLLKRIGRVFTAIKKGLNKRKQEHPDLLEDDHLRDTITSLFEGKVSPLYSQKQLDEIYKRGNIRYEREVSPGYLDVNKEGVRKYGDLVLWFQVIDKAKETKKPIILVTDDRKDDWWLRFKGKTIGPRPELVEEMLSQAGVSVYMYQADQFMTYAQKYIERQVKQAAIDEVRDVRRYDEEHPKPQQEAAYPLTTAYPQVHKEYLKALQEAVYTRTEAPAFRIPDETLRTMQQAQEAAMQVVSGITDKALRAMQQQAQEAAMQAVSLGITDKALRAMQQQAQRAMQAVSLGITEEALRAMQQQAQGAMQAAVLGTAEGTTESIAEDGTISLDSEPEEEPVG